MLKLQIAESECLLVLAISIEGCLDCVDLVSPTVKYGGPGCFGLIKGYAICAVFKAEDGRLLHQIRKVFLHYGILLLAGINETVELFRMAMQVKNKGKSI